MSQLGFLGGKGVPSAWTKRAAKVLAALIEICCPKIARTVVSKGRTRGNANAFYKGIRIGLIHDA